jgi:SAM-dependent methyltransferase
MEWNGHSGPRLDTVEEFDVIECALCEFRHIVPLPTVEELEHRYSHDYYSVEKPLYIEHTTEDLEWWELVYAERYDLFESLLPADRRRVLDVGSGPGFFLLAGKRRGWDPVGLDPSKQASGHSRGLGLETVEAFLNEDVARGLGSFDLVNLSEVLEHLPDPAKTLGQIERMLSAGGLVSVVVPNDYNPFQHALRTACGFHPWWVAPPHHINYFTFESLTRLLSRQFEVVSTQATFPIDMFLLMGDNYVGNDALGRACHARRKAFELNLERAGLGQVRRNLYSALAKLGLGREIVMTARKNDG